MKIQILKSNERGHMKNTLFEGRTVFSNGMPGTGLFQNFGTVYVLNDDILYPESRLGMHPHKNVEIITVMISGTESHSDTLGAHEEYQSGDVQLISSGKGIKHAGGNVSKTENARHLQIWVNPSKLDLLPSVQVLNHHPESDHLKEKLLASPDGASNSLLINQNVWIYQVVITQDQPYNYQLTNNQNGILIYVLEGNISVNRSEVQKESTAFISKTDLLDITSISTISKLILIETVL